MPKKVYIAGPMTGLPEYNRPAFFAAEEDLKVVGLEVLNPARTDLGPDASWRDYMRSSLKQIAEADVIVILPGWVSSRGARIEVDLAESIDIPVMSVGDLIATQTWYRQEEGVRA